MGGRGSGRKPYRHLTRVDGGSGSETGAEHRSWPVRNPECDDIELQDEAVQHLQRLYDAVTAEWTVDGDINPLIGELAKVESVCVVNGIIKESKMGKLLAMMADGMLHA